MAKRKTKKRYKWVCPYCPAFVYTSKVLANFQCSSCGKHLKKPDNIHHSGKKSTMRALGANINEFGEERK